MWWGVEGVTQVEETGDGGEASTESRFECARKDVRRSTFLCFFTFLDSYRREGVRSVDLIQKGGESGECVVKGVRRPTFLCSFTFLDSYREYQKTSETKLI